MTKRKIDKEYESIKRQYESILNNPHIPNGAKDYCKLIMGLTNLVKEITEIIEEDSQKEKEKLR